LQGRYFVEQRNQAAWENAVAAYQQALEIDPDYATAWAALSFVLARQAGQGYIELNEGTARAREAALTALQLEPNLAEGHVALGNIQMTYDWDWESAEKSLQTALDLAPGDSRFLAQMGLLKRYQGRLDESIALNRSAVELDPLVLSGYHQLGLALFWAGQLEEALGIYDRLLVLNPDFGVAHLSRSRILLVLNRPEEAMAAAEAETDPFWHDYGILMNLYATGRVEEAQPLMDVFVEQNHHDAAYQIAQIYGFTGDNDLVFEWLELAYQQRDGGTPELLSDPFLVKFSDDPRWTTLLQKMGLYEAWLRSKA
jgi:tetratricopeptide (TPR) repeat protein